MTTQTIIFSKDRAAQLDLLLQSIRKFAPQLWPPMVLWKASDADFEDGYVESTWGLGPRAICEVEFKTDLLSLIDPSVPLTMFLVDDDVIYLPFPDQPINLKRGEGFSLRLGNNLTHCWNVDKPQAKGQLDWDATCNLDGTIYRTDDILDRFRHYEFNNPNDLEGKFCEGDRFALIHLAHSVLVGIPHNLVSTSSTNRHMGGSAAELNEKFLDGWRIDLEAMDFSNVYSVHQPIEYKWRRR